MMTDRPREDLLLALAISAAGGPPVKTPLHGPVHVKPPMGERFESQVQPLSLSAIDDAADAVHDQKRLNRAGTKLMLDMANAGFEKRPASPTRVCGSCGKTGMEHGKIAYVGELKRNHRTYLVRIDDLPAMVCPHCKESSLTSESFDVLEKHLSDKGGPPRWVPSLREESQKILKDFDARQDAKATASSLPRASGASGPSRSPDSATGPSGGA